MVDLISPPDPHSLLPPLLACLPTAFVSTRPPPALLPLLSPILRQRVQILSSVSTSPTDSWLRLLCWDSDKAEHLQTLVDRANFEPHPVSGEIELPGEISIAYKRVDEETLHSRILLPDFGLKTVYLWCPNDQEGGGPGWRVAELIPHEGGAETDGVWSSSIGEANVQAKQPLVESALREAGNLKPISLQNSKPEEEADGDDDDDYWAQYDATPGRTPNVKTPAPNPVLSLQRQMTSEASYFSQYADVQPAMDSHDPSEEQPELGPSSLNGDMLASLLRQQVDSLNVAEATPPASHANGASTDQTVSSAALNHPRPSSASSTSSDAIAKLEQEAENQSACEVGVKQHISSNIKSLFRLAKITGLSRAEFQSLIKTELEMLELSDHDD